jgi:hypothetical protein
MRRVDCSALRGAPCILALKTTDGTALGRVGEGAESATARKSGNTFLPDSHRRRRATCHLRSGLPARRLDTAPP